MSAPACQWCGKPATTRINIAPGKGKLQLVDVCPEHERMILNAKEAKGK